MKKYLTLPIADILKIDFEERIALTPFLSVGLDQASLCEVVFNEDNTKGTVSYDALENTNQTYNYINPDTGVLDSFVVDQDIHITPTFYDSQTMEIIDDSVVQGEIDALADFDPNSYAYIIGDKFKYEGKPYIVVQGHTSQLDWKPDELPALYRVFFPESVIAPWVQPTGAQDAYDMGAQVSHNGSIWESLIDANVWEPGVVGSELLWTEI